PKVLGKIMRDKLERPSLDPRGWRPGIPDELAAIVIDVTKREPEERLSSAAALEGRLRAWLSSRREAAAAPVSRLDPSTLPPPAPRPEARDPGGPGAAVWLGSAIGLGTAVLAIAALTAIGVAALWRFRPAGGDGGAVASQLAAQGAPLGNCALRVPDERRAGS